MTHDNAKRQIIAMLARKGIGISEFGHAVKQAALLEKSALEPTDIVTAPAKAVSSGLELAGSAGSKLAWLLGLLGAGALGVGGLAGFTTGSVLGPNQSDVDNYRTQRHIDMLKRNVDRVNAERKAKELDDDDENDNTGRRAALTVDSAV